MTVARNIHESDLRVSIPVLGAEEPAAAAKRSENPKLLTLSERRESCYMSESQTTNAHGG